MVANKLTKFLISFLFRLPFTIVIDPVEWGTGPKPLSVVWQRGLSVCLCVARPGGPEVGEPDIKALTIHSSQVLFPATALRHDSPTSCDSGLTDHSAALWPRGPTLCKPRMGGTRGPCCVLKLPTIIKTMFVYVLTRRGMGTLGIREVAQVWKFSEGFRRQQTKRGFRFTQAGVIAV